MLNSARILAATVALAAVVATPASAQNYSHSPNYGTVALTSGFAPDPVLVAVQSGGSINAETRNSACRGFITDAPDYRVNFTAGSAGLPLIISAASSADVTLIVNGPDAQWYCDDDGGVAGLNPMVMFATPGSGQYDIWVGTYGNASNQPSTLVISELYSR
jgi:hypothetical protein